MLDNSDAFLAVSRSSSTLGLIYIYDVLSLSLFLFLFLAGSPFFRHMILAWKQN